MKFFLSLFFIFAACLLGVSNAFAQQTPSLDEQSQAEIEAQAQAEAQAEVEKRILEELGGNSYYKFSPLIDLFFGVSIGVSAFEIQNVKGDIEQYTQQLNENLNQLFITSNPYLNYKKKFAPPFFFSLDFKLFHNWYGIGMTYDRHFTVIADYQISTRDNFSTNPYNPPLTTTYTLQSDGFRLGPWFRQKIYIPQVQLLASLGYSYGFGTLKIKFDGSSIFSSSEQIYKTHSHGLYGQIELMVFYKNLTYGLGILLEGRKFNRFSNDQGILYGQDGAVLSVDMLKSPMVYLRIGVAL